MAMRCCGVLHCRGFSARLWGAVVGKGVVEYRSASVLWNVSRAGFGRPVPG